MVTRVNKKVIKKLTTVYIYIYIQYNDSANWMGTYTTTVQHHDESKIISMDLSRSYHCNVMVDAEHKILVES